MIKIVFQRARENINTLRSYKIILDDKLIDEISNGATKEILVEKGIHRIKAKIDWCTSNEVEFISDDGDEINIHISGCTISNWVTAALITLLSTLLFIYSIALADYNQSLLILINLLLIIYLWNVHDKYLKINYKQYSKCERSPL